MKVKVTCDRCGNVIFRWSCELKTKKHFFCSRSCMFEFASKSKNPDGYTTLKNLRGVSENMKRINREMNANRMTPEVREKLRKHRLGIGDGKTYEKTYGIHTHRVVAEQILGRKLRKGEVVHHIDGDFRNNSPKNLMVLSSQKEHAALHAKINLFFWGEVVPK